MAYSGPLGGNAALEAVKEWVEGKLAGKANAAHTHAQTDITGLSDALAGKANSQHTHVASDVTDLTTVLADFYKKIETYSKEEVNTLISNLNSVGILNKNSVNSGVVEATTQTVDTVCDEYVQTNYSRAPKDNDGILVTLMDNNDDIVLYMYTSASSSWVDISRGFSFNVSSATDTVAGIMKLYNALGAQTDGAITPAAVKTKTDAIESSISNINTTLGTKADASALQTLQTTVNGKADASSVYKKTETYSKTEVDGFLPVEMTKEQALAILNGTGA